MELRVLGPVQAWSGGGQIDTGPPQRRAVLAALVVDAGRPVPYDTLVHRVWDDQPPTRVRAAVHAHVTRVRRLLADLAAADGGSGAARLIHQAGAGGYLLQVDPDRVDLHRFRRLVAEARDRRADGARLRLLREAMQLWRAEPLSGLRGRWVEASREAWRREYLAAVADWAAAETSTGEPAAVVGRVSDLVATYPLAEPLTAALMRALYATGQAAEALDCYTQARTRLVAELGAEPGPELQALQQAILRGERLERPVADASGAEPAAAPAAGPADGLVTTPVPAQLPADTRVFTGRGAELAQLDALLADGTDPAEPAGPAGPGPTDPAATTVLICAVAGTAGVGKTALAIRWAHRVADRFPDGQLYLNLRGYDPDRPVLPGEALAGFLRGLGVPGADIPPDLAERAAQYRTVLAGRRMLVVLDNAASVEQVRPLLPGSPGCAVLVTSRDALAGLVAVHGAHRIVLDVLPAADAVALLGRLVGPERLAAEPAAAATLADQCGRLPLALRIAAELATRRGQPLAGLVAELTDERQRLAAFDASGDPRAAVTAVFSWSLQHLPAEDARMFRLLGLHPGPDLDPYAAAALADTTLGQARRSLDTLARAHLVQPAGAGRYGMHDLLRAYAAGLAADDDPEADRRAALTRLLDYYLATAAAATDAWHPAEARRRPQVPPAATPAPDLAAPAQARAWLDTERAGLAAACAHAATRGWPGHAVPLAAMLFRYLNVGGHYTEALAVHGHARQAARDLGDRSAEGITLINLGATHGSQGRFDVAAEHLTEALGLLQRAENPAGAARALSNLGTIDRLRGRYDAAVGHLEQAVGLYRQLADRSGEATGLINLGHVHRRQGRAGPAAEHFEQALRRYRQTGNRNGEAEALTGLAHVHALRGRYDEAAEQYRACLPLFRQTGDQEGEAAALVGLGGVLVRQGRLEQAAAHQERALARYRHMGDRSGEAAALNGLGQTSLAAGEPAAALERHLGALALAVETGNRTEQARAHHGVGDAHHDLGDLPQARGHWQDALLLYTELDAPEAGPLRAALARTGTG